MHIIQYVFSFNNAWLYPKIDVVWIQEGNVKLSIWVLFPLRIERFTCECCSLKILTRMRPSRDTDMAGFLIGHMGHWFNLNEFKCILFDGSSSFLTFVSKWKATCLYHHKQTLWVDILPHSPLSKRQWKWSGWEGGSAILERWSATFWPDPSWPYLSGNRSLSHDAGVPVPVHHGTGS